jgi:hypothetical protein
MLEGDCASGAILIILIILIHLSPINILIMAAVRYIHTRCLSRAAKFSGYSTRCLSRAATCSGLQLPKGLLGEDATMNRDPRGR